MNPKYPIYVVSKSRWKKRHTSKALEAMNVPYFIVVEAEQFADYASVIAASKILVLDKWYQQEYDTCDKLGLTKSVGAGAARNFAWQHAIDHGFAWHWVMDDNIAGFFRLHHNRKIRVDDGTIFRCAEDFCERYKNIAMAGLSYHGLTKQNDVRLPFILNTRIYSCNLIRNDVPFRWRGRYSEDTILSLDMLKAGWVTIQFTAFIQNKLRTQVVSGGNTEEFYAKEGTLPKSKMCVLMHPDVSRLTWRFGRWHHFVDYRPFRKNVPILKDDIEITAGVDDYGMELVEVAHGQKRENKSQDH